MHWRFAYRDKSDDAFPQDFLIQPLDFISGVHRLQSGSEATKQLRHHLGPTEPGRLPLQVPGEHFPQGLSRLTVGRFESAPDMGCS